MRSSLLMNRLALFACGCLRACVPKPQSNVRFSEAWDRRPLRVVLLPASCSSVSNACQDEYVGGVAGLVQNELELAGYSTLDAQKLVQSARSRKDVDIELSHFDEKVAGVKSLVQVGSVFEDLSPAGRRALLAEAEAKGIVSVAIQIGTEQGTLHLRQNTVQIRLGLGDGGDLAWVSRCEASSAPNGNPDIEDALEQATRCALDAALGLGGQGQVK
jgi:hypothetical protein